MAIYELKNIVANPFRHIKRYPIKRDKVVMLRESLQKTGFWDNVVAREVNGKAEIAYGHHRLVALREEYGPSHKVDLIIKDLSDEIMIQIMARENMEEWDTSALVEQETVRAVVQAYADGLIKLPDVPKMAPPQHIRYAPSFIPGEQVRSGTLNFPYTAQTVGEFIGWLYPSGQKDKKIAYALTALQFIDEGILKESDFEGLSTTDAKAVVEQARQAQSRRESAARVHQQQAEVARKEAEKAERYRQEAAERQRQLEADAKAAKDAKARADATRQAKDYERKQAEAAESQKAALRREQAARKQGDSLKAEGRRSATNVGRAVSASLKKGEIGYRQAKDVADRVDASKGDRPRPDIKLFAKRLATELNLILDPTRDPRIAKLDELVRFREYLDEIDCQTLASVLERISERSLKYATQFNTKTARLNPALRKEAN